MEAILVAVNQGESRKVISQFLKNKKLTDLTVAMDKNQNIGRDYQVQGIPKTVIIDQEGIIRHVEVGFSWRKLLLRNRKKDSGFTVKKFYGHKSISLPQN